MQRLISGLVLSILFPALALAQTAKDSWANLKQLQVGQKIQVVDMDLKSFKGTFVAFSEEAITLRVQDDEVAVQRGDVLRVRDRARTRRRRNALIGFGIGAAAGAVGMVIAHEKKTNGRVYYGEEAGAMLAAGAVWGGAVGAGVGAVFPSHPTIYRVQKLPERPRKGGE